MKKTLINSLLAVCLLSFAALIFLQISFAQNTLYNTTTISPVSNTNTSASTQNTKIEPATAIAPVVSTSTNTDVTATNTITQDTKISTSESPRLEPTSSVNMVEQEQTGVVNTTIQEPVKNVDSAIINTQTTNTQIYPEKGTEVIPIDTKTSEVKIENTSNTFQAVQTAIQNTKEELKKIVDQNINEAISKNPPTETTNIENKRTQIISNIDTTLNNPQPISQEKIIELSNNIKNELNQINNTNTATTEPSSYSKTIEQTFNTMSLNIEDQVKVLKAQGGDLLFKDTNNDGISDYDSVHVYNIDPVKPTPTTTFEGRTITAGDKVLLGFDPTTPDLVKIAPEEPVVSEVKPTESYKVEEVKLSPDKKITISGRFLPNTYITVYIYSTPIIVTVKTDVNGEWKYTLDKELDDGKHTIYTATVNNTGKILAKSPAFGFIKTAEAATLENLPPVQIPASDIKPGILSLNNIYIIAGLLVLFFLLALVMIGRSSNKKSEPLLDYINLQTQRGFSKEVITNELLNNGWTTEDIEGAFKIVSTSNK